MSTAEGMNSVDGEKACTSALVDVKTWLERRYINSPSHDGSSGRRDSWLRSCGRRDFGDDSGLGLFASSAQGHEVSKEPRDGTLGLSGQHGEPRRARSWRWVLVVAATMTVCVLGIAWIVKQQPPGVNTRNRWSDFYRTRVNLRPPAPRVDHVLGSTGSEGGRKMTEIDMLAELGVVAVAAAAAAGEAQALEGKTPPLGTTSLAEPEVTEATVMDEHGQVRDQQQRGMQAKVGREMQEAGDADKPSVLLVIAVVTIRPDRRAAIRNSWLAWGDDRVVLRFFTEAPDESQPNGQTYARELEEESAAYGDLVVLNIESGMNFAVKLLSAMKYASGQYNFDFFLRLDDDYFVCLHLLLDELESVKNVALAEGTMESLMLYAGFRYCVPDFTRIDEAYMLLSGALVHRVLSIKDLRCARHAGITSASWYTVGHDANKHGDVRWVYDPRIDQHGNWWKPTLEGGADPSAYAQVCETHMGVHHTYPEHMAKLWDATKHVTAQELSEGKEERGGDLAGFKYLADDKCKFTDRGMALKHFQRDGMQPCETFQSTNKMHCGAEGC